MSDVCLNMVVVPHGLWNELLDLLSFHNLVSFYLSSHFLLYTFCWNNTTLFWGFFGILCIVSLFMLLLRLFFQPGRPLSSFFSVSLIVTLPLRFRSDVLTSGSFFWALSLRFYSKKWVLISLYGDYPFVCLPLWIKSLKNQTIMSACSITQLCSPVTRPACAPHLPTHIFVFPGIEPGI